MYINTTYLLHRDWLLNVPGSEMLGTGKTPLSSVQLSSVQFSSVTAYACRRTELN